VFSSRKIAKACIERMDFAAVTGFQKPDFRTISLFRKRHLAADGSSRQRTDQRRPWRWVGTRMLTWTDS